MNDYVFVMCNLKLNDNQVKKQDNNFPEVLNDLSSNDDWITKEDKYDGSSNFDLPGVMIVQHKGKMVKKTKVMMKKILMMLELSVMKLKIIQIFRMISIQIIQGAWS